MWETIWETAVNSGIWTMLFIALFFYQIKDSKSREAKYQETIDKLADKLNIVNDINDKLDEFKSTNNK